MPPSEDPWMQTRLELAEIKGMLNVSLQNHGERISATEKDVETIHTRVNTLSSRVTTAEAEVRASVSDRAKIHTKIGGLEERLQSQFSRSLQTAVGLAAVMAFLISVGSILGIGPT